MKTISRSLLTLSIALGSLVAARAELKPGANLLPYEIHNTSSGEEYCQMCAYSSRPATVAAYGNLQDEGFWTDLQKLQKLQDANRNFGFYGQVLDSKDSAAIQAAAKKHGVTFPMVYAVDPAWRKPIRSKEQVGPFIIRTISRWLGRVSAWTTRRLPRLAKRSRAIRRVNSLGWQC